MLNLFRGTKLLQWHKNFLFLPKIPGRRASTIGCYKVQLVKAHSTGHNSISTICCQFILPRANFSTDLPKPEWVAVYHFRYIVLATVANRLKLYQTFFTLSAMPLSAGLYHFDVIPMTTLQLVCGAATIACITLYIFTNYFRRLIGLIYWNNEKQLVKIAHLTFWGRRNDLICSINDIVPLSDGECKPTDAYVKLQRYSTQECLYLSLSYGKILNNEYFEKIFGSLDVLYGSYKRG